jgi:hypothetical protein
LNVVPALILNQNPFFEMASRSYLKKVFLPGDLSCVARRALFAFQPVFPYCLFQD